MLNNWLITTSIAKSDVLVSIYIHRFELKCLRIKVSINILISKWKVFVVNLVKKNNISLDSVNKIVALLFVLNMLFNELTIWLKQLIN